MIELTPPNGAEPSPSAITLSPSALQKLPVPAQMIRPALPNELRDVSRTWVASPSSNRSVLSPKPMSPLQPSLQLAVNGVPCALAQVPPLRESGALSR